jgi:membrane-associated PAP2 superfamily phosphatase
MNSYSKSGKPSFFQIFLASGRDHWWLLAGLLLVLIWDASGLDLALAHWYGTDSGFPLQHDRLLSVWLHDGVRKAGWVLLLALTAGIWLPVGPLRRLTRRQLAWMVGSIWMSLVVVVLLKGISRTSCPWDVDTFGGPFPYVSHWNWLVSDGGPGRCFPGGHASTAFAFLPVAWWLRGTHPAMATVWLVLVMTVGLSLGWVQQMRGAHYFSHNLWTLWVCATTAWAMWVWGHRQSTT